MFKHPSSLQVVTVSVLLFFLGASSALAREQLKIVSVDTDIANQRIVIRGDHFDNGHKPNVRLGSSNLKVIFADRKRIKAKLPANIRIRDYLLQVKTGRKSRQIDTFDVTVIPSTSPSAGRIVGFYAAAQERKLVQPGDLSRHSWASWGR